MSICRVEQATIPIPVLLKGSQRKKRAGKMTNALIPLLLTAALAAGASAASAADWQFEATPYLFASGIDGDVKIGRLPAGGVEASFSDLTKVLDYGFMMALEGRNGDLGFITDAVYMKVGSSAGTP